MKTKSQTYAEGLAALIKDSREANEKMRIQTKNRLLQKMVSEITKQTKHATKLGHDNSEIHFPDVYENDSLHKDVVADDLRKDLIRRGLNRRDIVWAYHEDHDADNEKGKHLVLRLAWNEPLGIHEADSLLNPPDVAST